VHFDVDKIWWQYKSTLGRQGTGVPEYIQLHSTTITGCGGFHRGSVAFDALQQRSPGSTPICRHSINPLVALIFSVATTGGPFPCHRELRSFHPLVGLLFIPRMLDLSSVVCLYSTHPRNDALTVARLAGWFWWCRGSLVRSSTKTSA
jgi:hypothetical protein